VHLSPNADVVPGLAESWDFSDDGSQLTMKVRAGMNFHDGNPVDAAAIVANLERNKAGSGAGDLAAMEKVEAVDDLTFTITFRPPRWRMACDSCRPRRINRQPRGVWRGSGPAAGWCRHVSGRGVRQGTLASSTSALRTTGTQKQLLRLALSS
jgi:MarR-like DNA-binding transcriptional regulator SgrR of sgrS sRNA